MSAHCVRSPRRSLASLWWFICVAIATAAHLGTAASAGTRKKGSVWHEEGGTVNRFLYVVIGLIFAAILGCFRLVWFFWKEIYNGKISEKALAEVRLHERLARSARVGTGDVEAPASPTSDHAQRVASYFQSFGRRGASSPTTSPKSKSPTSPESPKTVTPTASSGGDKGGAEVPAPPKMLAMMAATSMNALRDLDDAEGGTTTQRRKSTSEAAATAQPALGKTTGGPMGATMRTTQGGAGAGAGAGGGDMLKTKTIKAEGGLNTTRLKGAGATGTMRPASTPSSESTSPTPRSSMNSTSALAAVATDAGPRPPSPSPADTRPLNLTSSLPSRPTTPSSSPSRPTTPVSDTGSNPSSRVKLPPLPEKRAPPVPKVPLTAKDFSLAPAGVPPTAGGKVKRGDSFSDAMARNGRLNMTSTLGAGGTKTGGEGTGRKGKKKSSVLPVDMGPTLAGMRATYRQTKQHK